MSHDIKMPGDYEYKALKKGTVFQKQWNKNRLIFLDKINFFNKSDIALDAGCGSGNLVLFFAKKVKKIEGWDININSVNFLKSKLKEKKIKNAYVHNINLLRIENKKQRFTKISLIEVIEHFSHEDYGEMLENLRSLMLPNSRIFITTPNDKSFWPILEMLLNKIQKYIQKVPTFEDRHLGHFDKKKIERSVEKAGFKIVKSGTMNFISPFLFFLPEKMRDKVSLWESENVQVGSLLYLIAERK